MKIIFAYMFLTISTVAHADLKSSYIKGYAESAYDKYTQSARMAQELNLLIKTFVNNPNEKNLEAAKAKWIEARKIYSQTEVYRFFDGPIDDADGPEGLINAWPLDEAYIDSVIGNSNSGIINNLAEHPVIDEKLLLELNEKDGEKNISTGWHAIEFLLWGQDISVDGPGKRKFTDFTTAKNAERRKQYLLVVSGLLVKHIEGVAQEWNPSIKNNFVATFIQSDDAFQKVIEAAKFLSGEELAMERMFVAYDTQLQEDEHSCFSDTTSNDIYYNFIGIKNVIFDVYNGVSFISMVKEKDADLAESILKKSIDLEAQFILFSGPFDQAILNETSRITMKKIIDELRLLADDIGAAVKILE